MTFAFAFIWLSIHLLSCSCCFDGAIRQKRFVRCTQSDQCASNQGERTISAGDSSQRFVTTVQRQLSLHLFITGNELQRVQHCASSQSLRADPLTPSGLRFVTASRVTSPASSRLHLCSTISTTRFRPRAKYAARAMLKETNCF
jgi:hypothetical protein